MTVIIDAVCEHYRVACGLDGVFTRHKDRDATCVLRVSSTVGAIRIAEPLSRRLAARFGRLAIGQVIGDPSRGCIWLTRPIDECDRRNAARLAALDIEILPNGSEVELPGPWDGDGGGRYWVGRAPSGAYRVRAADVIAEVFALGRTW